MERYKKGIKVKTELLFDVSGSHGRTNVIAIPLHRMALAYVSIRKRGFRVPSTRESGSRIHHKERVWTYGGPLQVSISIDMNFDGFI